jgi:hypothetical protein
MTVVERHGDMGRGVKLRLLTDSDGDVIVICDGVDQMTGKPSSVAVEFCRPGLGGGRSPQTLDALRALMFAMQSENDSAPFNP